MKPDSFDALLLLPRLRVQNANAVSGPMTWGFPAPSAFTGFVHALERRLSAMGKRLTLGGVGIVCHQFDPQVFQPPGRYTQVFCLTRNPVDKDGDTSAIVEEGRSHLEVSLVLAVSGQDCPFADDERSKALASLVLECAESMRLAGGSVLPHPARAKHPAQWAIWERPDELRAEWRKLRRRLMPGFVLVSREGLLAQHLQALKQAQPDAQPQPNALDALLDLCRLNIDPEATPPAEPDAESAASNAGGDVDGDAVAAPSSPSSVIWAVRRRYPGWLVPVPVGYAAVSPLYAPGAVKNARDAALPFRFVESVLSLGEWVSPHRVAEVTDLLWRHDAQPDAGLYRVHNPYSSSVDLTSLTA
jgi:CRISPR-associated protein Csy2